MRRLACVCNGGVERRDDDPRRRVSPILRRKPVERFFPPRPHLSLAPRSPSSRWLAAGGIAGHYGTYAYIRGITWLSLPHPARAFSLLPRPPPHRSRAITTVIIPRCKLHNLVTVSPGPSLSRARYRFYNA